MAKTDAEDVLPGRVLIVDDDEILCEAMELTLSREGLEIGWVGSAQDAIDQLVAGTFDFDVIVTDMSMPVIGGVQLCERVRALRPDVPVIMLSGHATVEAAASARRAGVHDYLVKPVGAEALSVAVNAALRHRHAQASGSSQRAEDAEPLQPSETSETSETSEPSRP